MDIRYLLRIINVFAEQIIIQRRPAMSGVSIAPYFPFRRIKIIDQSVLPPAVEARIQVKPDRRFQPICHFCGQKAAGVHSWTQRSVRDLNLATARVWITCHYRKLLCPSCRLISIEDLELFHPYLRVTTRLALYIHHLCRFMTVTEVAQHLQLDWKTVKNIDKWYLEGQYGQPNCEGLRILAVDEIAIKKGHRYLTVVLDYLSGRVVYVGKDRKAKTLKHFFNQLTASQRKSIDAVVMDMWDPYINAVKKNCPKPKSYSIYSTWLPILTASSTRCETANITKPANRIKSSTKAASTFC
jgi:transposase